MMGVTKKEKAPTVVHQAGMARLVGLLAAVCGVVNAVSVHPDAALDLDKRLAKLERSVATPSVSSKQITYNGWVAGALGENCVTACGNMGMTCNATSMMAHNGEGVFPRLNAR